MADWSTIEASKLQVVGDNNVSASDSNGTFINAHAATPHTKGSWTELTPSSGFDSYGITVVMKSTNAHLGLVDLGIGAAASEKVIIANLLFSCHEYRTAYATFPVFIPAGTRVSARAQSEGLGHTVATMEVLLMSKGFFPGEVLSRVETWGPDTATSRGVVIDAGGTTHTKGAYSQLVAATANDVKAALFMIGSQRTVNDIRATADGLLDIAIGAAGSEKVVLPDLQIGSHTSTDDWNPLVLGPFDLNIPAGTRVSARMQASTNLANIRTLDLAGYGVS